MQLGQRVAHILAHEAVTDLRGQKLPAAELPVEATVAARIC
jgi:hypothetical protein